VLPRPPELVDKDDRGRRDPGAWGYYTEIGPYRRALWLYRTAFALCLVIELGIPLVYMIEAIRRR